MKIKLLVFLTLFVALSGCTRRMKPYTAMVSFVSETPDGTLKLRANGHARMRYEAGLEAEKNAMNTLLFRGIPGSQQVRPLIADEQKARSEHAAFFRKFIDQRGYGAFIIATDQVRTDKIRSRPWPLQLIAEKQITQEMNINLRAMRTYLEQQKVIRTFGL